MIVYLNNSKDFEKFTKEKCLVDFYADWCGPCKKLGELLENMELDCKVIKIDTDKFPELATKFGVMSIPTILLMENSKIISKHVGFLAEDDLKEFIKGGK